MTVERLLCAANSNTPPPNHPRQQVKNCDSAGQVSPCNRQLKRLCTPPPQSNGLNSLYGPITDTRLGRDDISRELQLEGTWAPLHLTYISSPIHQPSTRVAVYCLTHVCLRAPVPVTVRAVVSARGESRRPRSLGVCARGEYAGSRGRVHIDRHDRCPFEHEH